MVVGVVSLFLFSVSGWRRGAISSLVLGALTNLRGDLFLFSFRCCFVLIYNGCSILVAMLLWVEVVVARVREEEPQSPL